MTSTATCASKTVLVVETDIILRLAIAEYLRGCGLRAIEASSALEAKTVLQRGPAVDVLFADARVAGENGGFALAQWTRRYRSSIVVVLTSSLANKSEAAAKLCGQHHSAPPPASHLRSRIESMRAHRIRRAQGPRRSGRSRASG